MYLQGLPLQIGRICEEGLPLQIDGICEEGLPLQFPFIKLLQSLTLKHDTPTFQPETMD
jgi:hypothetical protein